MFESWIENSFKLHSQPIVDDAVDEISLIKIILIVVKGTEFIQIILNIFHSLYRSPNTDHVARIKEGRNVFKILTET